MVKNSYLVFCLSLFLSINAQCEFSSSMSEKLTWKSFQKSIEQNSFSSVDELLKYWSEQDPIFFQNYTLVYHSLSLQDSSFENPRALVFGDTQELVLTFNGDPKQRRYDSIELLRWTGNEFEFRDIKFENGSAKLSQANPKQCLTCHTKNALPIWDSYDRWPRVYGSIDDAIIDFIKDKYAHTRFPKEVRETIEMELNGITQFNDNRPNHIRYQYLHPPQGTNVTPYFTDIKGDQKFRPNLRLTRFFAQRLAEKLEKNIKERPCFKDIKALYYGSLLKCQNYSSQKLLWQETFKDLSMALALKGKWNEKIPWSKLNPQDDFISPKALFLLLGLSVKDFNLVFNSTEWSYFQGKENVIDLIARLVFLDKMNTPIIDPSIDIDLIFKFYFYNSSDPYYSVGNPELGKKAQQQLDRACMEFVEFEKNPIDSEDILSGCLKLEVH